MKTFKSMSVLVAILMMATQAFSQTAKPKYGISGGVLGGLNYTQFRMKDAPSVDYKNDLGYAIGGYLNIPLTSKLSLEPQAQLSWLKYSVKSAPASPAQFDGTIQYQSFPILLKYQTGKNFALIGGPQFDFTNARTNTMSSSAFTKTSFVNIGGAATAGVEFFPRSNVQFYGRYIYGFSDYKYGNNPNVGNNGFKYYNDGIQLGVKVKLFGKMKTPPVVVPPAPVDTDGDGIVDSVDKCPTVPGVAKYQGCPVPDTDKDGINDEQDKCPTVPGVAKYQGCPIPDTDGDGINDEQDKCPNEPGTAANQGCPDMTPILNEAAKSFYFVINSAKLMEAKIAQTKIDPVLELLNKYPKLRIDVQGNTDNTGNDKINNPLSQRRADAVKAAFVKKGIAESRFTTKANGSSKPVADNKTKAGRKLNRNVTLVPSFAD